MSDDTTNTVSKGLSDLGGGIFQTYKLFTDQVASLTHQYGGQAVHYAEQMAQLTALVNVIHYIICALIVLAFWIWLPTKKIRARVKERANSDDETSLGMLLFLKFSLLVFIIIYSLCVTWDFIGLFYPDIWIGHEMIKTLQAATQH